MIRLEPHPDGVVLAVRASPGARKDEVRGEHAGALKVAVTQAPEKGKANKAISELLANHFQLRRSQVELLSGESSSQKRFLIRGVTVEELRALISD